MLFLRNPQIVSHRKDIAYTVGAKAHDVFVPRVVNHAFEGDVSLFNDDSDWFVHTERVTIQRSATVNGSEKPQPKIVIKRRSGKNLNPVVDALHSLNLFHHVFSIRLQNWARYLLQEGALYPSTLYARLSNTPRYGSMISSCPTSFCMRSTARGEVSD